jgi:hypothetical protein
VLLNANKIMSSNQRLKSYSKKLLKEAATSFSQIIHNIKLGLTVLLTPQFGRSSAAAARNSLPYFAPNSLRISRSSGMSAHLEAANIKLERASRKSTGHCLFMHMRQYKTR